MKKNAPNHPDFHAFQLANKLDAFRSTLNPKQEKQFMELMDFFFTLFGGDSEDEDDDDGFFIDLFPVRRLTIKVQLKNVRPAVWRKLEIPSNLTLEGLSIAIQVAMGWDGSHLHEFRKGKMVVEENDEMDLPVGDFLYEKGDKLTYEYDMGDSWEHWVELVADPVEDERREIRIIGGKNACPPEDFGGPWYYTDFVKAWVNHDEATLNGEFSETVEWLDEDFDPTEFDLEAIQEELDAMMKEFDED